MRLKLKAKDCVFYIDENDSILDNGCCYQIISKTKDKQSDKKSYTLQRISTETFSQWLKAGFVYTDDTNGGLRQMFWGKMKLWEFNFSKIKEYNDTL